MEQLQDINNVIITPNFINVTAEPKVYNSLNFKVYGFSVNADYHINENSLVRVEYRTFYNQNFAFVDEGSANKYYPIFTSSLILSF